MWWFASSSFSNSTGHIRRETEAAAGSRDSSPSTAVPSSAGCGGGCEPEGKGTGPAKGAPRTNNCAIMDVCLGGHCPTWGSPPPCPKDPFRPQCLCHQTTFALDLAPFAIPIFPNAIGPLLPAKHLVLLDLDVGLLGDKVGDHDVGGSRGDVAVVRRNAVVDRPEGRLGRCLLHFPAEPKPEVYWKD